MKRRVGFLGTGWIGRHRLEAIARTGAVEIAALCDPSPECLTEAAATAPAAERVATLDAMLALGLDGVVIATPSAYHAAQSIQALKAGAAVFCQKPLGRSAAETAAVVAAARAADRLLGVDLSYRHVAGMRAIRDLVGSGDLGTVFAVDLVFHNAYGPDKPWFYDRAQSGGGCVIDLGVHLVDLALWTLGFPDITDVRSLLRADGAALAAGSVEDYAVAQFAAGAAAVRLACSWRLQAGVEAAISATFYGRRGGATLHNVDGSFYALAADRLAGTATLPLAPIDADWGGRAAVAWARRLAGGERFDPAAEEFVATARVLDAIYAA